MKLSVSAFQASCSASAQKILHHHAPSYGSTSSTAAAVLQPAPIQHSTPPHLAKRPNPTVKVEEVEGNCSSPSPPPPPSAGSLAGPSSRGHHRSSATSSRAMVDSTGVVAPSTPAAAQNVARGDSSDASVPSSRSVSQEEKSNLSSALPSLGTSREEEAVGSDHASDASDRSSSNAGNRYQNSGRGGSSRCSPHPPLDRSKSTGERRWANLRAVVALYGRLRQIKRTKSNQRWMKLRTTVQLSGAISNTIQKKAPLKREDSFLKRFSTRQVAEQQETMDAGEDSEGGGGSGGGTISHCQAKARRRRKAQQEKRSVVNPDENFYFYWLMVLTVCVLYNLWTLIVRQSFPELQRIIQPTWFMLDALTDVIFLLDIAVQFRTGYLEQGLVVYNSKKLASHYIHSRAFLLDVSSLTPLDLLQFNLGINPILRFPRFLKVYRIYDYYYMVESRTVYPNLWRVVNLVHILLILAHWFGCFYFLLSEAEGFQGEWVYPYRPGDYATLSRKYLGSLYWSTLTLTTIGDLPTPETNAEGGSSARNGTAAADAGPHANNPHPIAQPRRGLKTRLLQFNSNNGYIFTIVSYLIGVFIFATIVGQVGNVITNRNANRLEFERLLDGAKTYMRHHKVPGDMKRRVLRWYDYSWSRGRIQGGGDINTALGLLPDKLKTELALHVNLSVLKKVTIFQECQPEFLHDLVLKMKAYIFTPGDLICRKGEVAREMFIIADGILEVISETGRVLTTMKAGDFFGEIGILNLDGLNKRTADVRSVGYSELFSLSREDVLTAMKDYPEAQEILQSLGRKRLMEARNVSKNYKVARSTSKRRISGENLCVGGGGVGPAGDSSDSTGKRIVDKIRSDVKGLKNALRKSRRSTSRSSKEDSIELQPLTKDGKNVDYTNPSQTTKAPKLKKLLLRSINVDSSTSHDSTSGPSTSSGSKGVLRRMTRVHSDEAATEPQESPQREMIGAGLPLLQRLLLLKAKEDREEKQAKEHEVVSPPPPPPAKQKVASPPSPLPPAPSVAPSGLPLIQRLLALKQQQREEATKVAAEAPPKSPPPPPTTLITPPTISPPPVVSPPLQKLPTIIRAEEAPPLPPRATVEQKPPVPARPPPLEPSPPPVEAPVALPVNKSPPPVRISPPPVRISPSPASKSPSPVRKSSPPIRKSPPPAIKSPPPAFKSPPPPFATPPPAVTSPPAITSPPERPQKPSLLQLRQDTKFYMSVDDLSPEYSGLPFVKKLKILNERQKLIELQEQRAAAPPRRTRSDCSVQRRRPLVTPPDLELTLRMLRCCEDGPSTPPSPESNETEERRNLKSILKKLSSNNSSSEQESGGGGVADTERKSPTTSRIEFRKLMRAQTVEGYAARHSKFSKSVTFDRETLQSPPADSTAPRIEPPPQQPPSVKAKMGFLLPSLMLTQQSNETRKEEEFFGDIITGMKQVIQNHLEEVQNKFHKRYQSLELEVKRRDEIISQLQNRIQELEGGPITNGCPEKEEDAEAEEVERRTSRITRGGSSEEGDISDQEETFSDQPFMRGDSVDTVISPSGSPVLMDSSDDEADRVQCSWEEHAAEETLELLDLPRSMSPQSVWHVSVDVPSSSSSSNSSSSTSPLSSPPIHNQDWEVQMLADELERRDQRQKLAEQLTGRSQQLSRSEVDILDRILQEQSSRRGKVAKNLSFDAEGEQKRKGDARKTTSVEHLVLRRRRKGSLTSWLQRKDTSTSALGRQQVLNARSLEEPIQQPERRPKGTRSSSIGHLPSGRSLFTSLSRFRLSIRGLSSSRPAAPTTPAQPDPESAVATISSQTHDQS
ncbi:uncharacterized protein LOC132198922 isoform X4 [Neocloeon triangulifer]|uniref:uncharacterized protein LOC132198922 isoform X4 n=1 Tax=Neocloeon triangulifer TaxID=2078957 RepID=UPI00286F1217|nr:uncharacterized protein LOC132198922 isoform X4 [Neocloeon triangulifer]